MSFSPHGYLKVQSSSTGASAVLKRKVSAVDKAEWNDWKQSPFREYVEVVAALGLVTAGGLVLPLTYHTLGLIYLLAVVALSLRVGRWPVLTAAVLSAVAWVFAFIPPRFSFELLESADGLLLGTYVVVALVAGQLTARIRAEERQERRRELRATALFHLTRALAEAQTLDEAIEAALRQADDLFSAQTALLLAPKERRLSGHAANSYQLTASEFEVASWALRNRTTAGRFSAVRPEAEGVHIPLIRANNDLGVFVIRLSPEVAELPSVQRDLMEGFAAQLAMLIEREQLRAASEREKRFIESDRLHRTLLDSVSHELKTPLAVLRAASEKLATEDSSKRLNLVNEIRTATRRLDHLVANLLNQNRLESGVLRPQMDWCDARDLITAARRATGDTLSGRVVKIHLPDGLPLFMADAVLMEQVLGNLLLNGGLYTPPESPLIVSGGVEHRGAREWVFVRVEDRGPGIPLEMRVTLFEKFRRGPQARAGGLGLGLAIARGFMLAQGGEIEVGDNPEGGARFTVYLPHVVAETIPNDEH